MADRAPLHNKVRNAWREGRTAITGWMHLAAPYSAEALARSGCDAVVIDLQHGLISASDVPMLALAIEAGGAEPFARVSSVDPAQIGAVLDGGVTGIIAPYVESAAEAELIVSSMHYPPAGRRSYGPLRPILRHGENYVAGASETLVALAMIETRRGMENLDSILAVNRLDGIFVGPSDLALSFGASPGSPDPAVESAISDILDAVRRRNRAAGIFCRSTEIARKRLDQGFSLVTIPPDSAMIAANARTSVSQLRAVRNGD